MRINQAMLDETDCQMSDIDTYPSAVKTLGRRYRRATATERVEHDIALVAAAINNSLKQGFGLLCGISETLCRLRCNRVNIRPQVLKCSTRHFVQISFVCRH